jgi:hypothetical protein
VSAIVTGKQSTGVTVRPATSMEMTENLKAINKNLNENS